MSDTTFTRPRTPLEWAKHVRRYDLTPSAPNPLAEVIEQQAAQIEAAIPAMREYARMNPKHHFSTDGIEQDPNGAHAWLARNDAALRQEQPT